MARNYNRGRSGRLFSNSEEDEIIEEDVLLEEENEEDVLDDFEDEENENVTDDFVDAVNEDSTFADELPELTKEDVVEVIELIDGISDAVLEQEGIDEDEFNEMDIAELLDAIEVVSRRVVKSSADTDTDTDDEEDEETVEEVEEVEEVEAVTLEEVDGLTVNIINIMGDETSGVDDVYVEDLTARVLPDCEEEAYVYTAPLEDPVIFDDTEGLIDEPLSIDDEESYRDDPTVIMNSSLYKKGARSHIQRVNLNSAWKKKSTEHKIAWSSANIKFRLLSGHKPKTVKDWAIMMSLAKMQYNKFFSSKGSRKIPYTLINNTVRKVNSSTKKKIARVASASRKRIASNLETPFTYNNSGSVGTSSYSRPSTVEGGDSSYSANMEYRNNRGHRYVTGTSISDGNISGDATADVTLQIPLKEEGSETASAMLAMSHKGNGVYVLKNASIRNSLHRGIKLHRGSKIKGVSSKAKKLNSSSVSRLLNRYFGKSRVIANKNRTKGMFLKQSANLGLVGIESKILGGSNRKSYSLFSSVGNSFVNSKGVTIPKKGIKSKFIIASPSLGTKGKGKPKDGFLEAERGIMNKNKINRSNNRRLSSSTRSRNGGSRIINSFDRPSALNRSRIASKYAKNPNSIASRYGRPIRGEGRSRVASRYGRRPSVISRPNTVSRPRVASRYGRRPNVVSRPRVASRYGRRPNVSSRYGRRPNVASRYGRRPSVVSRPRVSSRYGRRPNVVSRPRVSSRRFNVASSAGRLNNPNSPLNNRSRVNSNSEVTKLKRQLKRREIASKNSVRREGLVKANSSVSQATSDERKRQNVKMSKMIGNISKGMKKV